MSQCVAIATQLDYGFVVQGINPLATFKASLRDAAHCNIMLPVLHQFETQSPRLNARLDGFLESCYEWTSRGLATS